jgi:hypothetical protein
VALLLSTNGQVLDDERIQAALLRHSPAHLIVAIDGLTDDTNSRFRAGARLKPALEGVRRLADQKRRSGRSLPLLHMRYIVMKHNQHELPRVEAFARENGFDLLSLRTLSVIDTELPDAVHGAFVPDAARWRAYAYDGGERVRRSGFIMAQRECGRGAADHPRPRQGVEFLPELPVFRPLGHGCQRGGGVPQRWDRLRQRGRPANEGGQRCRLIRASCVLA